MEKLTQDQKRIKLAEHHGFCLISEDGYCCWRDPDGHEWQVMHGFQTYKDGSDILPDYFYDLNSMHEIEERLTPEQRRDYASALHPRSSWNNLDADFEVAHRTAAEKAEVYGLVCKLWELGQ
jgi:hypothetical protein